MAKGKQKRDKTLGIVSDLARIDAFTDEDIARQIAEDPDVAPDMSMVSEADFPRVRGSQILPTKQSVTIRLSPEVIAHFRKDGAGWQTRLNDFLLEQIADK